MRARRPKPEAPAAEGPPVSVVWGALRVVCGVLLGALLAAPLLIPGAEDGHTLSLALGISIVVICAGLTWRYGAKVWDGVASMFSFLGH